MATRKKYTKIVSRKLKDYGETDFNKKKIKVNPSKGDLVNTVLHEELHAKHPNKPEKWIKAKADKAEKKISVKKTVKMLKEYVPKTKSKPKTEKIKQMKWGKKGWT